MDDNKEREDSQEYYHHHHHENCWLCDHPVMKHIITALMVLIGSYLAFYTLADWHFKRMTDPAVQIQHFERNMMKEQNRLEKMYRHEMERNFRAGERQAGYINLTKGDDAYEITVNLRPFDNNEKNVEVQSDGDILTVSAAGEKSANGHDRVIKVTQQYAFDKDVDMSKITKVRKGNNYIITVPFEK